MIETLKAEPKTCDIVKHFNGEDAYTTIDIILNNVDKIMQAIDNNGKKRLIVKTVKHSNL